MNYKITKTKIPNKVFKNLILYVEKLIKNHKKISLQLTDNEFKQNNKKLYNSLINHFNFRGDVYITIRISFSDNNINHKFHYDGHSKSTVIPIIFKNFKSGEYNGDLYLSKKSRNFTKNWLTNLLTKIIMQNLIYRFFLINDYKNFNKNFNKIDLNVGDEISFNGFRVFHGNTKLNGKNKIRASLIVHSGEVFTKNRIYNYIKTLRHRRNRLN